MDRSQVVAVVTGAIALLLGLFYLAVVTLLDFRGEMQPAPLELTLRTIGQATPGGSTLLTKLLS
ncbi:hypothetical protein GS597_02880 [Synechococcales cyanobacterium C]|uniref:Uncharacterized protein n=1 Tax=Petrachloros mirabilis ULC683 TaxID=2781853 RepID=A0A8K2AC03_9CYAN|nr:hypothetical protein [Petrachloros mirabilis]NCJ05474.1 hypothetical protein [Petrachloros mirabilis ULC683]